MHILTVIGARPQLIKASALSRCISGEPHIHESIVHTGQHYDYSMSGQFFDELKIPAPLCNLEVGSGNHGAQTGSIMAKLELLLPEIRPDLILVYGDTNSTLAAALVAAKAGVPLAHVEAGLRSFRRKMPEEINRIVTDRLSEYLFCPSQASLCNLASEGITEGVFHVGDIMLDTFHYASSTSESQNAVKSYKLKNGNYILVTVHRAENTNSSARLKNIFSALERVAQDCQVVLPLHPRTRRVLNEMQIKLPGVITLIAPCSYSTMVGLTCGASTVATDSGGLQKEAYFAGVPCVTLRDETEWVETLEFGWNRIATPNNRDVMYKAIIDALSFPKNQRPLSIYGDGDAAGRILDVIRHIT